MKRFLVLSGLIFCGYSQMFGVIIEQGVVASKKAEKHLKLEETERVERLHERYSFKPLEYQKGTRIHSRAIKKAIKACKKYRNNYVTQLKVRYLNAFDLGIVQQR
jgi:ribosomal protein L13